MIGHLHIQRTCFRCLVAEAGLELCGGSGPLGPALYICP